MPGCGCGRVPALCYLSGGGMSGMLKGRGMRRPKAWRGCFLRLALVRMQNFSGNRIYFWVARGIYMWRAAGSGPTSKQTIYMKVNVKYSHQDI